MPHPLHQRFREKASWRDFKQGEITASADRRRNRTIHFPGWRHQFHKERRQSPPAGGFGSGAKGETPAQLETVECGGLCNRKIKRMQLFRKASIKRKQTLLILLTAGAALLLACFAFATYEIAIFRTTMVRNLTTLAEIIGNNTTAALDFNDAKNAEETLSALKAEPGIIGAGVYNKDGQIFATYDRPNDNVHFTPPPVQKAGYDFNGHALV